MDICDGTTHWWSDDSYAQGSHPCPGPPSCIEGPRKRAKKEAKMISRDGAAQERHDRAQERIGARTGRIDCSKPILSHRSLPDGVALKVSVKVTVNGRGQRDQLESYSRNFTVFPGIDNIVVLQNDPPVQAGLDSISIDFEALEAAVKLAREYKT
jgi:hypothetical protein